MKIKYEIRIIPRAAGKHKTLRGFDDLADAVAAMCALGAIGFDHRFVSIHLPGERLPTFFG